MRFAFGHEEVQHAEDRDIDADNLRGDDVTE